MSASTSSISRTPRLCNAHLIRVLKFMPTTPRERFLDSMRLELNNPSSGGIANMLGCDCEIGNQAELEKYAGPIDKEKQVVTQIWNE